jgi:AcrR family transcriptional regulator
VTREQIVAASMRLIDTLGLAALTARRLARTLDSHTMTFYSHFTSKSELLVAVAERACAELSVAEASDWMDAVRGFATSYRMMGHKHPGAFPLAARRVLATRTDAVEYLLATLLSAGFPPDDAVALFRAVASYCHGFVLEELSSGAPADSTEAFNRGVDLLIAGFGAAQTSKT